MHGIFSGINHALLEIPTRQEVPPYTCCRNQAEFFGAIVIIFPDLGNIYNNTHSTTICG
jgi:hypothetical protein